MPTNWRNKIIQIFIILLAVSPAFALGEGNRNLLLISAMGVSPYFFFRYPMIVPKVDLYLLGICFSMICFPMLLHPETMRWSTVLYSCMFCMYFMAFVRVLIGSNFTLENFSKLLEGLIYAYCIVLIIQQFCVLSGLPIFNLGNYSPREPWKLNSLMSEPSHSARIIPVFMYIYICTQFQRKKEYTFKESFNQSRLVWFSFLWTTITMGSATAFIFMIIVFLKFINIKRFSSVILSCVFIGCFMTIFSENDAFERVKKITVATLTLDEEKIIRSDGSGSYRIVPTIRGAKKVGFTSTNDWFGHGIDADLKAIQPLPGIETGNAGSFYMWFNYGVLVAFLFWFFSLTICWVKKERISILIWFLCIFMYGGINNQIIWLVMALFFTYKHLSKNNGIKTSMA